MTPALRFSTSPTFCDPTKMTLSFAEGISVVGSPFSSHVTACPHSPNTGKPGPSEPWIFHVNTLIASVPLGCDVVCGFGYSICVNSLRCCEPFRYLQYFQICV